ncbi:MAG: 2-oxo acid dehydrogenase subunit E2 [Clostridia bacterium]|nr:2-oxo acid dehydrogenase subunit E2 [Clostridia bacterium]
MFGRRADGVRVKGVEIIEKAAPYFMPTRIDAVQLYTQPVNCETLDKFILEQKEKNGIHYTYTEIFVAAAVRMLYTRPKTNRFINNCMIYQRKFITISMTVKERLSDDAPEETLKFYFTGRESLPEVKKIMEEQIVKTKKPKDDYQKTTKAANFLCHLPNWLFKFAMWFVRTLDKHDLLPMSLIDASPFHTSLFVTDVKSIHLDKIYHHLYNFGNTTIFAALGKVKHVPVSDLSKKVRVEKRMDIGFTLDERVCDGLYYSNSIRYVMKHLEKPELLLERLPEPELTAKEKKKKEKQDKKNAKKKAKLEKTNARKNKKEGK